MSEAAIYYFGCWDRIGHYLCDPSGRHVRSAGPFTDCNLDGTFPNHVHIPGGRYNERVEDDTIASLAHWKGWTVLAMWDRSVDTRAACNAAFIAEGEHTHAEMWALARQHYPKIVARLKAAPVAPPAPRAQTPTPSTREELSRDTEELVDELRRLCSGRNARALIVALTEMYARVLSGCVNSEVEAEKAIADLTKNVRGWWVADRGGPFMPS